MNGSRDCHTECSNSDREGEMSCDTPYMWNLNRNDTNERTYKRERERLTDLENELIIAGRKNGGKG